MLSGSFLFPGLIYSIHLQPGADPSLLPPTKVISGLRIDEEKKERLSGVSLIFFSLYVVPFKEIEKVKSYLAIHRMNDVSARRD